METLTTAKLALQRANQNEQYSRKNNIKIMDIEEQVGEDEYILTNSVCNMLDEQDIRLDPKM